MNYKPSKNNFALIIKNTVDNIKI